jgi:hypothetical protein
VVGSGNSAQVPDHAVVAVLGSLPMAQLEPTVYRRCQLRPLSLFDLQRYERASLQVSVHPTDIPRARNYLAFLLRPPQLGRGLLRVTRNPESPLPPRFADEPPVLLPPKIPIAVRGTERRALPIPMVSPHLDRPRYPILYASSGHATYTASA